MVVLGDSIATGSESGSDASFAQLYAKRISEQSGQTVSLHNLADPSESSSSLLTKLQSVDGVRAEVAGANIVTITVGGNNSDPFAEYDPNLCAPGGDADACLAGYVPDLEADLDGILTEIETLRDGAPTAVRLTSPDYNPFIGVTEIVGVPAFPKDFGLGFYRQVAAAMTDAACRVAQAHQADCADFFHVFNGAKGDQPATAYLAEDHLHPSHQGRQAIADVLLSAGFEPLF